MQLGRPSSFWSGVSRVEGGWYVSREMGKHCSQEEENHLKWNSIHGKCVGVDLDVGV